MRKSITTTRTIDAPPSLVWEVLTDLDRYGEWNPFIPEARGALTTGARPTITVTPSGGRPMTFRPVVVAHEPGRVITWVGRLGVPGVFDGRHSVVLTHTPDGRTMLHHGEVFSGVLVPFAGRMLGRTRKGFLAMNEALADLCEKRARSEAIA